MALSEIRKLGDPVLFEKSVAVTRDELETLLPSAEKMWQLIKEFREAYGRGRAIAAPQIGLLKRMICMDTGNRQLLINPEIESSGAEMIDVWDDCMSFPNLFVFLQRHRSITVSYYDINWEKQIRNLENDMSELFQHEYDHLNGILAISRAKDISCFKWVDN